MLLEILERTTGPSKKFEIDVYIQISIRNEMRYLRSEFLNMFRIHETVVSGSEEGHTVFHCLNPPLQQHHTQLKVLACGNGNSRRVARILAGTEVQH